MPPTYLEQKRKEAQMIYREEQAYINANKAEFERLMEEDRQAMAKEMSGNMLSTFGMVLGGGPGEKKEEGKKA